MKRIFVDTGGWYALQVPNDRWHKTATDVFREVQRKRLGLATSNLVIGETYTLLRMSHGSAAAWRFVEVVSRSALLERWPVSEKSEREAWTLLRKYDDQPFSFVDATSFALMGQHGARHALAFDGHFATAGFVRLGLDD